VQAARVVPEALVELERRAGAEVADEHAHARVGPLVERVHVLRGDGAAGVVKPAAAVAVGLVQEPRRHLAVWHLVPVDRHDQRRLGVRDLLAHVFRAVAEVRLAGEAVQLGGGA
jgi:hypothetical protein